MMNRFFKATALLSVVLTGLCFSTQAEEAINLKYSLEEGQVFRCHYTSDMQTSQSPGGVDQDISQCTEMDFIYEVMSSNEDGLSSLNVTWEAIKVQITTPMGEVSFDSASDEETSNPETGMFSAIVGKSLGVVMASDGEIVDITGGDELMESILDQLAPEVRPMVEEAVKSQMGETAFVEMFRNMAYKYPKTAIATGDSWVQDYECRSVAPFGLRLTAKLVGFDDETATLALDANISALEEGNLVAMGPFEMSYNLTGGFVGEMVVSRNTGWPARINLEQTIEGTVEMLANEMLPEPMSWPLSISNNIEINCS